MREAVMDADEIWIDAIKGLVSSEKIKFTSSESKMKLFAWQPIVHENDSGCFLVFYSGEYRYVVRCYLKEWLSCIDNWSKFLDC